MANYLVYWRGYWGDVAHQGIDFRWNTRNDAFFRRVRLEDHIWVVVSGGSDKPDEWRLLQRIVVADKGQNLPGHQYGHNRIEGDETGSQVYDLTSQPDLTPVLHEMEFDSGRRITSDGAKIGQSLQSIRTLTPEDARRLAEHAATLRAVGTENSVDPSTDDRFSDA